MTRGYSGSETELRSDHPAAACERACAGQRAHAVHVPSRENGWCEQPEILSHHSEQHTIENKPFISGIFHLIFLGRGSPQVTETRKSKTADEGGRPYNCTATGLRVSLCVCRTGRGLAESRDPSRLLCSRVSGPVRGGCSMHTVHGNPGQESHGTGVSLPKEAIATSCLF